MLAVDIYSPTTYKYCTYRQDLPYQSMYESIALMFRAWWEVVIRYPCGYLPSNLQVLVPMDITICRYVRTVLPEGSQT